MTEPGRPQVLETERIFEGRVISLRRDTVDLGVGGVVTRDIVEHPGAVGVVALNDKQEVLLIRQYRHALGQVMWELPAGLLDVEGEDPQLAAARELAEEGKVQAEHWQLLLRANPSPGMSDERIFVYLAEHISGVDSEFEAEGEELTLELHWTEVPVALRYLDEGDITNGMAVMGLLALDRELTRRVAEGASSR